LLTEKRVDVFFLVSNIMLKRKLVKYVVIDL